MWWNSENVALPLNRWHRIAICCRQYSRQSSTGFLWVPKGSIQLLGKSYFSMTLPTIIFHMHSRLSLYAYRWHSLVISVRLLQYSVVGTAILNSFSCVQFLLYVTFFLHFTSTNCILSDPLTTDSYMVYPHYIMHVTKSLHACTYWKHVGTQVNQSISELLLRSEIKQYLASYSVAILSHNLQLFWPVSACRLKSAP